MAKVLDVESRVLKPPPAVALIDRHVVWKPGYAIVIQDYKTSLPPNEIEAYYATMMKSQGWMRGARAKTRPLTAVAMVYHHNEREFRLSFGFPGDIGSYSTSLMWGV
jgi:hypothetical protein